MGAYAGSVLWEEGKHFVTYNGTIAKPNDEDKTDVKYGYYMLLSKDIIKICAGSGQPFLAYNTLNKIKLLYPSDIEEQRKIANLLSDIDNVISTSEQEVANLEEQKKGAMQKIFSQEVRFKADDGSEYPDWKEKRIRDLFDIAAGGDIDKENSSDIKSEEFCYPVYANALVNNGLYGYANYYKIDGDTLTITGRGDVGHAVARHESYVPIVRLLVLKPKKDECVDYFAHVINMTRILIESTGVPQLTAPQVGKIKVFVPELEEQQKISNFLSDFDIAIESAKQELEY